MKQYIGTKTLNAKPMTRAEWCEFRGWALPTDEKGEDAGYLVEYTDGGKPNHPDFAGYISWSPSYVFEKAYIAIGNVGHLQPHQQRVVGEAAELNDKLTKLKAFLDGKFFPALPVAEQSNLISQSAFMKRYHSTLLDRIAAF